MRKKPAEKLLRLGGARSAEGNRFERLAPVQTDHAAIGDDRSDELVRGNVEGRVDRFGALGRRAGATESADLG